MTMIDTVTKLLMIFNHIVTNTRAFTGDHFPPSMSLVYLLFSPFPSLLPASVAGISLSLPLSFSLSPFFPFRHCVGHILRHIDHSLHSKFIHYNIIYEKKFPF